VPAHLDVVANVLATQRGLRLIDFEYAAAASPARELGQVVWEAELDRQGLGRLVRAYGTGAGVAEEATAGWAWITGVTWTLWALARQDTPVLQQYARRSWERLQHYWAGTGV
jgi:thiamine kinase-like enzyme